MSLASGLAALAPSEEEQLQRLIEAFAAQIQRGRKVPDRGIAY